MKVRILKNIVSVHGTYKPGQVVDLPSEIARAWMNKRVVTEVVAHKPDEIPEGLFWCEKHETLHKLDSSVGRKCNKRQVKEEPEEKEEEEEENTDESSQGEQEDGKNESNEEEDEGEGEES